MPYANIDEKTPLNLLLKTKIKTAFSNLKQNKKQEQKTKIITKILSGIFISSLFFLLPFIHQTKALILTGAEKIPYTPTILAPQEKIISHSQPLITGLTSNDAEIEIYIDNNLNGFAKTKNGSTGTANFAYRPNKPLSAGAHEIRARAKVAGNPLIISLFSEPKQIEIVSFPAPTLIAPTDNTELSIGRPVIRGLAKNDSYIKLYINDQEETAFKVKNHPSGTANFAYQTKSLKSGNYFIYAQSLDLDNRRASQASNQLNIKIRPYVAPTILDPINNTAVLEDQLTITGVALNDSKINIYIDNKLAGATNIRNHQSGVGNFAYKIQQPLKRGQTYLISASAIDNITERESSNSSPIKLTVNHYYIAPTLLKATALEKNQPTILGIASNDSKIEILVNNKIDGSLTTQNHPSGTANFAYKIKTYLISGTYKITSRAYDAIGKSSLISNTLSYYLTEEKPTVSAETAPVSPTTAGELKDQTGKIETKDEEQGKAVIASEEEKQDAKTEKTDGEEQKETDDKTSETSKDASTLSDELNIPLIVGLVILGILIIIFIIWYFKQKQQETEENIDNLFDSESPDDSTAKSNNIKDDFANFDLDVEKKDNEHTPPPPPSL